MPRRPEPHSLLTIPVPEMEPLVRPRLERCTPELVPVETGDVAAHVTLLTPFAGLSELTSGLIAELRAFFADVTPFELSLTAVNEFPGGTVYLAPSPAATVRNLTHELARQFPEYPPYGGAFDEVIPHLSVPLPDDETLAQLEFALAPRLPVTVHAREAALYWWEPGASRTLETFPFGTSAA